MLLHQVACVRSKLLQVLWIPFAPRSRKPVRTWRGRRLGMFDFLLFLPLICYTPFADPLWRPSPFARAGNTSTLLGLTRLFYMLKIRAFVSRIRGPWLSALWQERWRRAISSRLLRLGPTWSIRLQLPPSSKRCVETLLCGGNCLIFMLSPAWCPPQVLDSQLAVRVRVTGGPVVRGCIPWRLFPDAISKRLPRPLLSSPRLRS